MLMSRGHIGLKDKIVASALALASWPQPKIDFEILASVYTWKSTAWLYIRGCEAKVLPSALGWRPKF